MSWTAALGWWIVAGVLVAIELASGTFYLLMLALGAVAAALAAHVGMSMPIQLFAAALVGGGAVAGWHQRQRMRPGPAPANANRDVNLDIGEHVHVAEWQPDGTASVDYRGARWSARHAGVDVPSPGEFVIQAIEGSRLVLSR